MKVVIGVDPHNGSHTATMLDRHEHELRRIKVRAGGGQVAELLAWADGVKPRTWAIESAGGMGYLLAQQLVAAGESVLAEAIEPWIDDIERRSRLGLHDAAAARTTKRSGD